MKRTVGPGGLLWLAIGACCVVVALSLERPGRWGGRVGFVGPAAACAKGRLSSTSGTRWQHSAVARSAARETETLEWVAAARGGGKDSGLLDMVVRKKDQFVSAVLEMEYQAQLEVAEGLLFFIRCVSSGVGGEESAWRLARHPGCSVVSLQPILIRAST